MIFYNENIMVENKKSPYTTITGCTFLFYEFQRMLPLLTDANSKSLLKDEIENNRVLQVNSITPVRDKK